MPVSGSQGYKSGFLDNPPRVRLREFDSALNTFTYPTILRTGDKDFRGKNPTTYDDTLTPYYTANQVSSSAIYGTGDGAISQTVQYPSMIPLSYPLMFPGSAQTPNTPSTIQVLRPVYSAPMNDYLTYSNIMSKTRNSMPFDEKISAFNESRINVSDNDFFATGTLASILPGFEGKVLDKTAISIDISISEPKAVTFQTGSSSDPYYNEKMTGMVYYNWISKKWETVGDISSVAKFDILDSDPKARYSGDDGMSGGMRAFSPSDSVQISRTDDVGFNEFITPLNGTPISNFGFPFASKFNATGSQLLHMENYITEPFLLEKVQIEFSASFGPGWFATTYGGPITTGFFLLNQFSNSSGSVDIPSGTVQTFKNSLATSGSTTVTHPTGHLRDIIGWGTIFHSYGTDFDLFPTWSKNKDLIIDRKQKVGFGQPSITGSWDLQFEPRVCGFNDGTQEIAYIYQDRHTSAVVANQAFDLAINSFGNRSGLGRLGALSAGRSYTRGVAGANETGFTSQMKGTLGFVMTVTGSVVNSPYLLLPTDDLILGYENTPNVNRLSINGLYADGTSTPIIRNEAAFARNRTEFLPGTAKITLYGSLLRDSKPRKHSTNQPLTSDAIHECIMDKPVHDQFQVEYFSQFRDTYLDDIFAGNMLKGTRGVAGRSTEGTQGTTGSILRGVKLSDESERFYDTLMPPLAHLYENRSVSAQVYSKQSVKGMPGDAYYFDGILETDDPGDDTFYKTTGYFPYPYVGNPDRVISDTSLLILSKSSGNQFEAISNYSDVTEAVFRVGGIKTFTNMFATPGAENNSQTLGNEKYPGAEKFRYGILSNKRKTSDTVFRYDCFGQFRDMLEQRKDSRFYNEASLTNKIGEPVITTIFVDSSNNVVDPAQTSVGNTSPYATSSLPYFDDVAHDRVSIDDNVIVIEEVTDIL